MATVRCRRGHEILDPTEQCAECGALPPHTATGADAPAPRPADGRRECHGCGLTLPDDADQCWECGSPVARSASGFVIRFPWGDWTHPGGDVVVGRAAVSPLADRLRDHLAVGRTHLRICVTDGVVYAYEERPSKHGTFVDGNRIEPGQRVPLAPGNTLRLGAGLVARVIDPGAQ